MADVKQLLKEAKQELARADYEEAISISKEVLKLDKNNYFAYVFLGKSYASLTENDINHNLTNAVNNYKSATQLVPENLLAWKGLFLLFQNHETRKHILPDIVSFDDFFLLCSTYMEVLLELQESQVDLINLIKNMKLHFTGNDDFSESYYKSFRTGTLLYELMGRHLFKDPGQPLQELIKILSAKETLQVSKILSQERLKLSTNDPNYQIKVNSLAWKIYKDSILDDLYNQLVNLIDDDAERKALEGMWLEYRIKVLKSMPTDIKLQYFDKIRTMVDEMVLIDHDSLIAWKYYFDWSDFSDLDSMDPMIVIKFFQRFPNEPLAILLYAWINSNFSSYNVKALDIKLDEADSRNTDFEEDEDEEELKELMQNDRDDEDQSKDKGWLSEEDILTTLIENIGQTKNSTLAYRIISRYYILNKEYEAASKYIKAGISLISYNIRDLGTNLINSKKELTIDLATCYTYVESPKNHKPALSLFDKILSEDPTNINAKIGKGIIAIEREDWNGAYTLITNIIEQEPSTSSNLEILSQLAWCKGHIGELDESVELFTTIVNKIEGTDLRTLEFKSKTLWRQAKVYISKYYEDKDDINIKIAFKLLVQVIKYCSDTYAEAYSLLGDIYAKFYNDRGRAFKCYYKAFELDSGDIAAAEYICTIYTDCGNWATASQIAERLIKSENAKTELRKANWPYRVMGISFLEDQNETDSIEWFQSALRVDPNDIESWVGLGQAYFACGRVEASIKVFEKAVELSPDHNYAKYFNSVALAQMDEFERAIDILRHVLKDEPEKEVFKMELATQIVDYSFDLYNQGYLMKAIAIISEAIDLIKELVIDLDCVIQNVWITLSKVLYLYLLVESKIDTLPVESLVAIFSAFVLPEETEEINNIDGVTLDKLLSSESTDNISIACDFLILASKYAIASHADNFQTLPGTLRSSIWYNLGISELMAYCTIKELRYKDAAIMSFKKSIKYQSNSPEAWIGFGIATMELNYHVAQHCFIKAMVLSPKDVEIWFNLALLALQNNDTVLAGEIMSRAQSMAPQNSSPWLGMALLYEKEGKSTESANMFGHSYILANGRSKIVQLLYASSVLKNRIGGGNEERDLTATEELNTIAFGLEQYFKKNPNDPFALQCALLVLERLHNFKVAEKLANRLTENLEKRFEKTQNDEELFNFAIVKSQLARIQLGSGDYENAVENANLSQGLLTDYQENGLHSKKVLKGILSNYICLGLSFFYLGNFDETLVNFQQLLNLSKDSKSLIMLISKVLYEVGDEAKEIAMQELTDYALQYGSDLFITLTIVAMTILENDGDSMRHVLDELKSIGPSHIIADKHKEVQQLIEEIQKRLKITSDKTLTQRAAFLFPNNSNSWNHLDEKIKQKLSTDGQNKITAEQLSNSYCKLKDVRSIQKSLFLTPWNKNAISALNGCF
ncbi:hypothetical protein KAFR_0B00250 [Kazachstania africana CBS 2517]|uniref:Superkiller protein 3 n=1 Tax=Kazachstania africana (strain ATCC 22294 / BCRC 22015 / CBS 2517 / CECT 1963 / NBRC 1671 / NRRL Y-8276) TaxID=1071382 RepID=H2APM5_KAZAF|nr:hypothetical protein KAFR_0B00250 [Kazachstania africana CBS 2517]CCF56325.1 hypothetical protein KAFR_0B00250 [Kazachstania africana CBS 2517]